MKDLVIPKERIRNELITLIVCFAIGFVANVGAIVFYKTNFNELFTSLHYVLLFSLVIYLLWSLLRLISFAIKYVFFTKKKTNKRNARRITANYKPMKLK